VTDEYGFVVYDDAGKELPPRFIRPVVYFIEAVGLDLVKIGYTEELIRRFKEIRTACPVKIQLVGFLNGDRSAEAHLHRQYKDYRAEGEWFRVSQQTLDYWRSHLDNWDVHRDFVATCQMTNEKIPWRMRADDSRNLMAAFAENFNDFCTEVTANG